MNLLAEPIESVSRRPSDPQSLVSFCDADLLEAWSRDRVQTALAVLVQRYSVMVLSVCRRRCRSEADAEDAFQTTFLYLARNAHAIRHRERLAGWLHRVAQRAAVATTKQSLRHGEPMVDPPEDPGDPLDRLTQRHEASVLDEELADLPEHYRSVIVLHLCEGQTIARLAEDFQTTSGSIRGRLQRGKRLLARRLRRRGIVPVFAFAAANAWTVSTAQSTRAADAFVESACDGELPDPPVETTLLESLLASGVRLMPTIYTSAGVIGGSTLIALMMLPLGTGSSGDASGRAEVAFASRDSPVVAQIHSATTEQSRLGQLAAPDVAAPDANQAASGAQQGGFGAGGGMFGGMGRQQTSSDQQPVMPALTSPTAERAAAALDQEHDFDVATPLEALPSVLRDLIGVPVLFDQRGVDFATNQKAAEVEVSLQDEGVPLRTALHKMLHPHGLKAVIQEEGLVITADPAALVHRGIGVSRWINVNQDAAERIAEALNQQTTIEFIELPLDEAVSRLSQQHDLPIRIDRRALEEIGLSGEEPVTITISEVALRTALIILLNDLDLTYNIREESLEITTVENAEQSLLNRIYWLEGTGVAERDFQSVMNLIQTSIVPDTWEALGGPSTMAPVAAVRPAILVSSTYEVHERVEKLLQALRETHFGPDPILQPNFGRGWGGMGGGAGGGGMGGGMGGGGMGGGGMF